MGRESCSYDTIAVINARSFAGVFDQAARVGAAGRDVEFRVRNTEHAESDGGSKLPSSEALRISYKDTVGLMTEYRYGCGIDMLLLDNPGDPRPG
jgi:hypothetical protein